MPVLRVLQTTIIKQSTVAAKSLPKSAIATLHVGDYKILQYKTSAKSHWNVMFDRKIKSADGTKEYQSWVVWGDDIEFATDEGKAIDIPKDVVLPVPFWNQVDNKFEPQRTCNTSSCAMAAKYLGGSIDSDDEYYAKYLKGDTTDHGAQTAALDRLGIKSVWRTDLDFIDLDESLKRDRPVVIGILHRGSIDYPTGGHMIVVIGKTAKGDYIVNDPYGSINDGYQGAVENGRGAVYARSMLERRWTAEGKGTGWGRIFA